jgi:hypothetical protein
MVGMVDTVGTMFEARRRATGMGTMMIEGAVRRCIVVVLTAAACLWLPAHAQYRPERGVWMQQQGRERADRREQRADRGRGGDRSQGRQSDRERGGSLTPDERRELNRDLQRANREFYRKGREGR